MHCSRLRFDRHRGISNRFARVQRADLNVLLLLRSGHKPINFQLVGNVFRRLMLIFRAAATSVKSRSCQIGEIAPDTAGAERRSRFRLVADIWPMGMYRGMR